MSWVGHQRALRTNQWEEFASRGYHFEIDLKFIFEGVLIISSVDKAGLNVLHIPATDKGKDHLSFIFRPKHFRPLFILLTV